MREDDARAAVVARAINLKGELDSQVTQKQVLLDLVYLLLILLV